MENASEGYRRTPVRRGRDRLRSTIRAAALAAGLGLGFAHAWKTSVPGLERDMPRHLKLLPLSHRNPEIGHNQPPIDSLDDIIRLVQANLATDKFMRDSLGIAAAIIEILPSTDAALDTARMRIFDMLQALDLRFRADETQRMRMGRAKGYAFHPGYIPIASAYLALRDSLLSLRSPSVKVTFEERPYRAPYSYHGDSTLAFLKRLRQLTIDEDASFRARLIEQTRGGFGYLQPRGVQCEITLGRLLTAAEIKDQSSGETRSAPIWLSRFRDRPLLLRIESLETLVLVAIAMSATAILAGLCLGIAFAVIRMRRRQVSNRESEF